MSWARIDDQFFFNPKVISCDKDSKLMYIAGLAYVAGQLTDGQIRQEALPLLGVMTGVANTQASAERLLKAGLWFACDDGYSIHDYLQYNPSKEKVLSVRDARKEAGSKGGQATLGKRRLDANEANAQANAQAKLKQNSSTIPNPNPYNSIDKSIETAPKKSTSKGVDLAPIFDAFTNASMSRPIIPKTQQRAAGELLSQIGGPMVAEYWQDVGSGRWPTDGTTWLRNNRTFQALMDRVNNWQDWVCAGRPTVTSTPTNSRAPAEVREPALFVAPGRAL